MTAVTTARNKALKLISEARAAYHRQLDAEMDSVRSIRIIIFSAGDVVGVSQHYRSRKEKKLSTPKTGKHVIIKVLGYGDYSTQPLGQPSVDVNDSHVDDIVGASDVTDRL